MMRRAARSTWITLVRRGMVLGTWGLSAAFAVIVAVVTFTTADEPGAVRGPAPATSSTVQLEAADGALVALGNAGTFLGVIGVAVGALVLGGVYQHGTLRTLLVRQPHRLRLLAGMWIAVVCFTSVAALVAGAVSVGASFVLAGGQGIDAGAWTSSEGLRQLAGTMPSAVLAMAGYTTLGAALAVLLRSATVALAVGVAWLLPIETILGTALGDAQDALPGQLLATLAQGGTASVTFGAALAGAAAVALVAAAAAATAFRRRDVA
jgi:ABC-type transport system involved in multi-copper enzyme maturation permease subunit